MMLKGHQALKETSDTTLLKIISLQQGRMRTVFNQPIIKDNPLFQEIKGMILPGVYTSSNG
jgi:hypothetical protein